MNEVSSNYVVMTSLTDILHSASFLVVKGFRMSLAQGISSNHHNVFARSDISLTLRGLHAGLFIYLLFLTCYYQSDRVQEGEMGGACSTRGENE
jgi:hypothetical protein